MRFRSHTLIAALVAGALLAGCATQGLIAGRATPPNQPSAPATPVTFSFSGRGTGMGGTLSVTLPDGETFSGRYLQVKGAATGNTVGFGGTGVGWWGGAGWGGGDWATFVQTYSGTAVAMLFGDRGHTMQCRFFLVSPRSGFHAGGIGQCQTSDGQHVDAQF